MSKRTLMLVVALVAALAIATTSTLAYLTSEDGAVNVMVVGNVEIEQNEEQRPVIGSTDLENFEQFKPFFPGVYDEVTMEEDANQWPVPEDYEAPEGAAGTEWQVYDNAIANVQDKFVTVENTGRNDAYVRTIIAVECPEGMDPELLHINDNADSTDLISFTDAGFVELDGVRYMVYCYTYQDALAPGESTIPSLKQVLLDKLADNEDVALLGDNFEILALSQAVQVEGFADADTALDEAFYAVGADASDADVEALIADLEQLLEEEYPDPDALPTTNWQTEGNPDTSWYDASATEYTLDTAEELAGLAKLVYDGNNFSGKTVKLGADIDLGDYLWTPIGQTGGYGAKAYFQGAFDGQGNTISNLYITETNEGANYAAGLFGFLDCGMTNTIGNFVIDGAVVYGHHWTGAAAGYLSGTLENVTVKNAEIICTHANNDACGDKAGAVVGYINGTKGNMQNCSAVDCTVTAGRDAGQVVGCSAASQVVGCTATNVTVTAAGDCTGANLRNEVIGRLN